MLELLPQLPPERRGDAAAALAETRGAGLSPDRRQGLVTQVLGLLADPRLEALFGPESRAEAALAGTLPGAMARRVSGQVDRLAFTATDVLVADTDDGPPARHSGRSAGYVCWGSWRVYRALLAQLAPGRARALPADLHERTTVLEITDAQLDAALARITAA